MDIVVEMVRNYFSVGQKNVKKNVVGDGWLERIDNEILEVMPRDRQRDVGDEPTILRIDVRLSALSVQYASATRRVDQQLSTTFAPTLDTERQETFQYLKEFRRQKRLKQKLERRNEAREQMRAEMDSVLRGRRERIPKSDQRSHD